MTSTIVLLLSGPNLNLLGQREPQIYGTETLDDHVATCRAEAEKHGLTLEHVQSNHEGELDRRDPGRAWTSAAAIIINAGAFSHYSWAIHDALADVRRADRRAAHLEPVRPRGVAAHVGVAPVATGIIVGIQGQRLPARGASGRGAARAMIDARDRAAPDGLGARGRTAVARGRRRRDRLRRVARHHAS